jgi:hypothetical protein
MHAQGPGKLCFCYHGLQKIIPKENVFMQSLYRQKPFVAARKEIPDARWGRKKWLLLLHLSSRVFVAKGGYAQKPFTLMGDGEISLCHNISHAPLYLYVHSGWMKQSVLLSSAASPTPPTFLMTRPRAQRGRFHTFLFSEVRGCF